MAIWFRMKDPLVSKLRTRFVNLKESFKVDNFGRWLWPPVCLVCGQGSDTQQDCCSGCHADLPFSRAACRRCALVLPAEVEACGQCGRKPPAFDGAWAGFAYDPPIAGLVQQFKFGHDLAAGRVLAWLLAERLSGQAARPDLIVPVPLNWRRQWQRGFNQAALLCRDLSAGYGRLPWLDALVRTRQTLAQSALPASQRAGNVRGAFAVRYLPPGARHVALVDDVMTTGATLRECARVLKKAGVGRVDVWVVARA
ncbi:MAG: ComF family protein [Wenzhouxiangellaceae bacterium]|nr:ComF family protein [Wenzhouxiangellaceae bacterium]